MNAAQEWALECASGLTEACESYAEVDVGLLNNLGSTFIGCHVHSACC